MGHGIWFCWVLERRQEHDDVFQKIIFSYKVYFDNGKYVHKQNYSVLVEKDLKEILINTICSKSDCCGVDFLIRFRYWSLYFSE